MHLLHGQHNRTDHAALPLVCANVAVCASLPCMAPMCWQLVRRYNCAASLCPRACIETYAVRTGAEHWHTADLWQRLLHTNCLFNCLHIHSTSVLVHTNRQLQPAGHYCCTWGILIPADSAQLIQQPARQRWVQQPKLRRLWAALWQQWLWCTAVWQCICCTSSRHW